MNKRILSATLAVAMAALYGLPSAAGQARKKQGVGVVFSYNSGVQWLSWDKNDRMMYVIGFLEGWRRGLFEIAVDYADCDAAAAAKQGLFTHISTDQLVDSVDKFYSDPINRQVTVPDALRYVLDEIRGASAPTLQKRLEDIRRLGSFNKEATDK